jgi:hypothetical protein
LIIDSGIGPNCAIVTARSAGTGIFDLCSRLDHHRAREQFATTMARQSEIRELSWPGWAPWALLAVAASSLLTIAATLYDIL